MDSYTVRIDRGVQSKQDLFARFTDTIRLGFSGIESWDAFEELMQDNFELRGVQVTIYHDDLTGISPQDRTIYREILSDLCSNWPDKVLVIESAG